MVTESNQDNNDERIEDVDNDDFVDEVIDIALVSHEYSDRYELSLSND